MQIKYLHRDGNLTDGNNLALMHDIYEVDGKQIRLPANLALPMHPPSQERKQAIVDSLGLSLEDLIDIQEGEPLASVTDDEIDNAESIAELKFILLRITQTQRALSRRIRILEGN